LVSSHEPRKEDLVELLLNSTLDVIHKKVGLLFGY